MKETEISCILQIINNTFRIKTTKRLDSKITSYKINGDSSSDNEICHNYKDVN